MNKLKRIENKIIELNNDFVIDNKKIDEQYGDVFISSDIEKLIVKKRLSLLRRYNKKRDILLILRELEIDSKEE